MSLICEKLGYYYEKNKWVLKDVNFKIDRGEIVGILGYSGCGKSTLSLLLSDFISPREGTIYIDGEKHVKGKFKSVQLIHQHPEKVMNPHWKMKKILEESYIPSQDILEVFGIKDEWLTRYPIELSGGELQRFSIVRALNPNTKYLIADEMTTMLDGITQRFIWAKLLEIVKKRDIGLIVISHEEAIINKICNKCYVIENGHFYEKI